MSQNSKDNELNLPIAKRKGVRSCTNHLIYNFISYKNLSPCYQAFVTNLMDIQIPNNIQEALQISKWNTIIEEEIRALEKNGTWELIELLEGKSPVKSKWIFTIKYKANGSVDRYKARLIAKGFTQSHEIEHHETLAPMAKLNTIRVLLSLVVNRDWPLHQLDLKNAFLNGDLE